MAETRAWNRGFRDCGVIAVNYLTKECGFPTDSPVVQNIVRMVTSKVSKKVSQSKRRKPGQHHPIKKKKANRNLSKSVDEFREQNPIQWQPLESIDVIGNTDDVIGNTDDSIGNMDVMNCRLSKPDDVTTSLNIGKMTDDVRVTSSQEEQQCPAPCDNLNSTSLVSRSTDSFQKLEMLTLGRHLTTLAENNRNVDRVLSELMDLI